VLREIAVWAKANVAGGKAGNLGKMTAAQARKFIDHLKTTTNWAIRDFLAPHLSVVADVKAGVPKAKIESKWLKAKAGFTRVGGFLKNAGRVIGAFAPLFDILEGYEMKKMKDAGYRYVPSGGMINDTLPVMYKPINCSVSFDPQWCA
jgi:hypothetical protein